MAKPRLFLLDTGIVLVLHELGIWKEVLRRCEVTLPESVLGEVQHYNDEDGEKVYIDLQEERQRSEFRVVSVPLGQSQAFKERFKPAYMDRLDTGEGDALTFLMHTTEEIRVCSADGIVYKVLACLGMDERGISLERLLGEIGLGRSLQKKFREDFRKEKTTEGKRDGIAGSALR